GLDADLDRVVALNLGRSCTPDVTNEELAALLKDGRYEATVDGGVLERSDVVIICVPTPLRKSKDPDISAVVAAAETTAARVHRGQLVVLESTTYPGTTEELLLPMFRERGARIGEDLFLAFSPERIDPANPTFEAAATKPFGFMPFYPGPGIGGNCIPVDPLYLAWKMRLNGYEARFIALADDINRAMPDHVVELVMEGLNGRRRAVNGARILALGVAYKRGVGDIRESPALEIIANLRRKGAEVAYVDPHVPAVTLDGAVLKAAELTEGELAAADCVLILTDHLEFDYRRVVQTAALVVDTRNATWGMPAPAGRVLRF